MNLQPIINGIITGCVYSLVVLGFTLIYNATKIFHFAHGVVYTFSAYMFFVFLKVLYLPLSLSILLAIVSGILLGILIELFVYRPLNNRNASSNVILISSLGFYIFLVNFIAMIFGNEVKVMTQELEKTYQFLGIIITRIQLIEVIVFVMVFPLVFFLLKTTRLGREIRAFSNNQLLSRVIGINENKIRLFVFGLGSGLASISAILMARDIGIDPNIGFPILFISAVATIIGGVDVIFGAILGAFVLGIVQNLVIWHLSVRWQETITFIILILFLLFRPQGILGIRKKRIEET